MNILKMLNEIKIDPAREAGFDTQRGDFLIIYEKELESIITELKRLESIEDTHFIILGGRGSGKSQKSHALLKLKALEIIIEKEVNIHIFRHCSDLAAYNDMAEENQKLTQQEYDLLKKVLL